MVVMHGKNKSRQQKSINSTITMTACVLALKLVTQGYKKMIFNNIINGVSTEKVNEEQIAEQRREVSGKPASSS